MKKLFLLTIFLLPIFSHAEIIERIVAIVNSEIITLSDLVSYKEKLKKGGLVDDALLKVSDSKKITEDQKELINHLINERLIDSEIKKQNLEATIERVEKEIRSIASKNGISRDQLIAALKNQGVSFSEYQDFLKSTIERQNVIEKEVSSKIKISDDEITEYYLKNSKNKDDSQYFEYELAHMLFLKDNGGTDAAEGRAIEVYNRLSKGQDFSDLASKFSEDPNFSQGGHLGVFKLSDMNKSLAKQVENLKPGEHTKVMMAPGGNYQIVKVNKKKLIPNPHLDVKKPEIQALLFEKAFQLQLSNWLDRKRQDAFIKINI
ncbi:MAG: peptidylprolyl isomerase [Bdellovibrionaceae bacterium]|nr:peptidylprolyl isomerase [Pseudobdellovibrionaceae bacterium]